MAATTDGDEADRIERELKRVHLPLLEEAGFIEWDRESGVVSKGPRFGELANPEGGSDPLPEGLLQGAAEDG